MVYAGKELYMKDLLLPEVSANDKIAPYRIGVRGKRKLYMALFYRQTTVVQ
jgi:hypothetical protein